MAWVRGLLMLALLACASPVADAQQTGRRVALVIGNSAYVAQGALANPGPDARLVADALRRVGFSVTALNDQTKAGMERSLRDFSRQADGAEVALVYYAGHGLEANGVNWLLPVDATLADERDLSFEAISLDTVLGTVERARGLRIVVLDACRNNPFARSMRRSSSTRATVTRGLADVEVTGTLVLYAARGGTVAQDGAPGANSPFATAFARRIPEPGVDIRLLVSKVRDDVLAATGRGQEPFSYGSLPGVELALVARGQSSGGGTLASATTGQPTTWAAPGGLPPFDVGRVHPDLREAVVGARASYETALHVRREAEDLARQGEVASAQAISGRTGYRVLQSAMAVFRGQADTHINGLGVLEEDAVFGDYRPVAKGRFSGRGNSLALVAFTGVLGRSDQKGTFKYGSFLSTGVGNLSDLKLNGTGVEHAEDAATEIATFARFEAGVAIGVGVYQVVLHDQGGSGIRYEGELGGSGISRQNGKGVLWRLDGTVLKAGIWANGQLVLPLQ